MPTQPNILFLLSDEHSYRCFSHLDPEGEGEPVHTPVLDALAARSTAFHQTYCQVALCSPSRICLLTGKSPMASGGWNNESYLKPDNVTLPEVFARAGYDTCLVGKMHLGGNRQFVGFQHRPYGDISGRTGHQSEPLADGPTQSMRDRTAKAGVTEIPESKLQEQVVARETLAHLREHRHAQPEQPWLLCASFSRPHFPLTAPRRTFERYWPEGVTPPKVGRTGDTAQHAMTMGMTKGFQTEAIDDAETKRARAAYFGSVDYLDEVIGDLLALLERDGLLDNTIVVYTADHGELAGEHGLWWKNSWHEAATRVPWFVQLPEHRSGQLGPVRLQTPVSLADLFPTLCGLAGLAAPADLEGTDLSTAIRQGREPERGPVFCDNPTPRWGAGTEHRVVRQGRHKYVAFRARQLDLLFDLEADPLEQENLAGDPAYRDLAANLRGLVDANWNFDAAEAQRKQDDALTAANALPLDRTWQNLYLTSDHRLIAADTPLYDPVVLTAEPWDVFADWPGDRSMGEEFPKRIRE